MSGVAPVPWRAREVEAHLTGKPLNLEATANAAEIAVKKAEPMEQNGYKVPLLKAVVEEAVINAARSIAPASFSLLLS